MHIESYQTHWRPTGGPPPAFDAARLNELVHKVRETSYVVQDRQTGRLGLALGGETTTEPGADDMPVVASLAPLYPEWLGDRTFCEMHGARFPYVTGAMANGIATTAMVSAVGRAGFLGFFGAAGLSINRVETAIDELQRELDPQGLPWGSNLINSPNEPALEEAIVDLYIRRGVRRISAAAYMALTPAVVRFACTGLERGPTGTIERRHHIFAKVSRPEVASVFLEPAPREILAALVDRGDLTAEEAQLAAELPVAEDITAEADSGGHTDNRPLTALLPAMLALRDRIAADRAYDRPIRVGAAGGLGTPSAVAAAFALGAAYVLTGSVNQSCVESGLDPAGREMLAAADLADVIMAPAADMFEMGVEVQVLQRGTMFGVRAKKLLELYRGHASFDDIPLKDRQRIEQQFLQAPFEEAWQSTRRFWMERDPAEVKRAEQEPKHRMALVFRSYLGQASRWAINGDPERLMDYQIWCGPAMGAFNTWVKGSFLEPPANRTVVQVARNLMEGAAVVTRAQQLRTSGVPIPAASFDFRPRPLG